MIPTLLLCSLPLFQPAPAGDNPPLSDWFGFAGMDVLPIGDDPGPMLVADIDGDGLLDIVVSNNRRSRIEVLRRRAESEQLDAPEPAQGVNEFPDHPDWERRLVPLSGQINGMIVHDLNNDGLGDFILGGAPGRITMLLQQSDGSFKQATKRDVRSLSASPAAFSLADIEGDDAPELLSIVDGNFAWWPLNGTHLGAMQRRPAGVNLSAVIAADYDGDRMMDVAGIAPDDDAPVRIWFAQRDGDIRGLGVQAPFEMPPLIEFEAIGQSNTADSRIAVEFEAIGQSNTAGSRIAVIERQTQRIVLYDVVQAQGDGDASIGLFGFADPGNRKRPVVLADTDQDGLLDVVAADTKSNAIAVYRQRAGTGLLPPTSSPTVAEVDAMVVIPTSDDHPPELVVLSTKEGFVGRSPLTGEQTIQFPQAIPGEQGWAPKAIGVTNVDGEWVLAIVRNKARKYTLDLKPVHGGEITQIDLGSLSRAPNDIRMADVDQDGRSDVLLLTDDRPMTLVLAESDGGWTVLEKDDMGQYGLVGASSAAALSTRDVDGDGLAELLSADRNYVRALRYNRDGAAPGWQVIEQINAEDPDAQLGAIATMDGAIVVADTESNHLLLLEHGDTGWSQTDSIALHGIQPRLLRSGALSGTDKATILALGEDAMATVARSGRRPELREAGSWRSGLEHHAPHELAVGDINSDGRGDMVALDAGEQMFEIFTFSDAGRVLHVTGFPVFESKLFSGSDGREYQPRQVVLQDVTGDGKTDVVLLVHDRLLVYAQ